MKSTKYYDQHADRLFAEYSDLDPDEIHRPWTENHLKETPGTACDIGAGSGRDANWLAKKGWEVIAVEPSKLRELGQQTSRPGVTWLNDSLPSLKRLRSLGHRFDLILLSGVWQHVPSYERERVIRILSELLNPSGLLVCSFRVRDNEKEDTERGFHSVTSEEIVGLANQRAIRHVERTRASNDLTRSDIRWYWHIFELPDDGTGSLPLLRHIVVNDNKSSSYKLGLLRTLVKLAESAPGIVTNRTDEYVEVPFGAVALYWIKLYRPLLLQRNLRQAPGKKGYGFAKDAFYQLGDFAPTDLSLGFRIDVDRANIVRAAIADVCKNIKDMPARYITYPGESSPQIFEAEFSSVRKHNQAITLTKEYLARFGAFRIPNLLWQTLGQFACWLDPAIVREWSQLIKPWQSTQEVLSGDGREFEWAESYRDTSLVSSRAKEIRQDGFSLSCVWSARIIQRKALAIDHCFPWARWPNNDLWNLLPTSATVNNTKSDRLPSAQILAEARGRITDWWDFAWMGSAYEERFFEEAICSLPNLGSERPSLSEIHQATQHQRLRLKTDQRIPEWPTLKNSLS